MLVGILAILENIKVENLIVSKQKEEYKNYKEIVQIAMKKKVNIMVVSAKDKIDIDKYTYINILYPEKKLTFSDINNNSLVLKFVYKDTKIMFTGDIEEEAEREILKRYTIKDLKSDILKIAHHGSKGSTTTEFLEAVSPKIALIGVRQK